MRAHLEQMRGRVRERRGSSARLRRVGLRHDEFNSLALRLRRRGQDTRHGIQLTRKAELPVVLAARPRPVRMARRCTHLPGCQQNSQRNGQVKTAALLGQVGRAERLTVMRPAGNSKLGMDERGAHALACFPLPPSPPSPTMQNPGSPLARLTSTCTCGADSPTCARQATRATAMSELQPCARSARARCLAR